MLFFFVHPLLPCDINPLLCAQVWAPTSLLAWTEHITMTGGVLPCPALELYPASAGNCLPVDQTLDL